MCTCSDSKMLLLKIPDLTDNCAINIFTCNGQVFVSSETAIIRQINPKNLETLEKVNMNVSFTNLKLNTVLVLSKSKFIK